MYDTDTATKKTPTLLYLRRRKQEARYAMLNESLVSIISSSYHRCTQIHGLQKTPKGFDGYQ